MDVVLDLSMFTVPVRPPPDQVTVHLVVAMMPNRPEEVARVGHVYLGPLLGEVRSP
jgi:hypothetical protein